ncbi:TonB-dependent siderophore receptor [Polynucleobacter cosmopolitanus]|jgi:iron complex outermembrane receptor protein|uniref:TonB-dependent siderophore receptor n=1 Tax=Polynucleobacter cosmopolitanus TaxID=351345 RepID=A0A229FSK4_9BURK|nr:TonB-dependent siderophore receptor [Polynucleobacter cosmopolitanus]OXL14842.1 TonB-dependent siderophore receptor [Polynucleobacter cosmopolitanus]
MAYTPKLNHIAGACALLFCINSQTFAQSETLLSPVVVTGEKGTGYVAKGAMIGGPGGTEEVELKDAPASISVISRDLLDDRQVKLISEAVRTDASVGDYYATLGYYENLSIRGFSLDPATSYRMNGMSLTGEQNFAFENKERVEILKGVSAMQAGASSPGGIVNFVTKRPKDVMSATVGTGERGTEYMAADFGTFLNKEKSLGIRINAAHENMKPFVKNAKGTRNFVSLAADAKLSNKTLAQFDIEYQDRSQIGVSGLMLLGDAADGNDRRVPTGIPADIQLNRYSWVLPTEIKSLNTGLKIDHELNDNNRIFFHLSRSEVKINDRQAYPYGTSGTGTFSSEGNFSVMDFRSENELRRNDQVQAGLSSKFNVGSVEHNLKYGASILKRNIFQGQAAYYTADLPDNIYSLNSQVLPNTGPIGPQTKTLDHQQNSLFIQDNMKLNDKLNLYLSTRFIELSDKSYSTSGNALGELKKNYLLPSIGATYKLNNKTTNYISYSEGVESGTRPIETSFRNAKPLKPRKTEQIEIGTRYTPTIDSMISATLFRATRANEYAIGDFDNFGAREEIKQDGKVVHTGVELAYAQKVTKRLSVTSSAMYLEAKQEGASIAAMNGSQAIGIPNWRAVMFADYQLPQVEKMSVQGGWTYVSSKPVTLDESLSVPGYHKFDAGLRYVDKVGTSKATYRLFVENLFDKFYWRDVSQTYGSNTLYPGTPRIFRATATFDF